MHLTDERGQRAKGCCEGFIIQPQDKKFHNVDMPTDVYRVQVDRVLPGCEDLYPPQQPAEADSELKVGQLKGWLFL
jgi:hypothetical protein